MCRYADGGDSYWTGYFTSRPALKGYIRSLSGYYLVRNDLDHKYVLKRTPKHPHNVKGCKYCHKTREVDEMEKRYIL